MIHRKLIKVLLVLFFLTMFISPVLAWANSSLLHRINGTIADGIRPQVFVFNISNATGTNNATHIFFNGRTNDYKDVNVSLNDAQWIPFYIDKMNNLLYINMTGNGTPYIYYNNFENTTSYTLNPGNPSGTFLLNESFDNLTLGDLNGQIGWIGDGLFDVDTTVVQNGSRGVTVWHPDIADYNIYKIIPARINQTFRYYLRTNSTSASEVAYFRTLEGTTVIASAGMYGSRIVDTGTLYGSPGLLSANKTYLFELNISTATHTTRVSNESGLVYFLTASNNIVQTTGINNITLSITGTSLFQGYFDSIIGYERTVPNSLVSNWSSEQTIPDVIIVTRYNNYTNNNTANFSILSGRYVNYSVIISGEIANSYFWGNNGTNQTACISTYCVIQVQNYGINNITINASNSSSGNYTLDGWNVTAINYVMELQQPLNTSTGVLTPVTLYWRQWLPAAPHTWQISTDYQFINIVTSGSATSTTENFSSGAVSLSNATKYYWRARNATGSWSGIFEFTTSSTPATPGQINATVFDEQNYSIRITNFTAQLYNSTTMITKNTTTGWANFSSAEVSSGQYLLRIVPNSSYASRNILVTSPTNATVYLPSTTNTINTIAFYLMDYTTLYPWTSSILSITKNNSVMHSSYFDADAKVAAYLIQGDSYGVTITNSNNIHNWGNYISVASGNVEVVVTDIAVNATSTIPFSYNLSHSTTDITLSWRSNVTLGDLNFTILKNNSELVHQLITTIPVGQSQYIVTDLNSTYYVYLTVNNNDYVRREVINYRAGSLRSDCGLGLGCRIMWGSGESRFELPQWMYNSIIVFLIWILAGSFGAIFAAFGAVVTVIFTGLFWYWGWLEGTALGAAFIGGIAILVIIDYLRSRE